ncbi:hypothetical protein Pmani_022233 [Petrolisthes manimaculis]|uniref:Ig-like domain-containing protein n=1 Tax=Petrolisthes manimaculis TaxID=1843537 RepID=A0AAE1PD59_9EUCA|nr:hypothetical protein Pmani_022233 [Petrolisthes manimaculis]
MDPFTRPTSDQLGHPQHLTISSSSPHPHQAKPDPLKRPTPDQQTPLDPLTIPSSHSHLLTHPDPLTRPSSHDPLTSPSSDIQTVPSRRFQSHDGVTSVATYLWPHWRSCFSSTLQLRGSQKHPPAATPTAATSAVSYYCSQRGSTFTVSTSAELDGGGWEEGYTHLPRRPHRTTPGCMDEGHYSCEVNTVPSQRLHYYITVLIPPLIVRPPRDQTAKEGEEVDLRCEATGDPQPVLTWRREDGGPFTLNHTQEVEAPGTHLRLSGVGREDGGAFLCVASNGVPPAVSARAQVSILFAPEMLGGGGVVVWAESGNTATLECHYRAYPQPHVTWTKDGALLTHLGSSRERYSRGTGTSTLVLRAVDTNSFGHYRCSADNQLGSNSTLLTLVGKEEEEEKEEEEKEKEEEKKEKEKEEEEVYC